MEAEQEATLKALRDQNYELQRKIGQLEMYREVLKLMVPLRELLPPSLIEAMLKLDPNAKT